METVGSVTNAPPEGGLRKKVCQQPHKAFQITPKCATLVLPGNIRQQQGSPPTTIVKIVPQEHLLSNGGPTPNIPVQLVPMASTPMRREWPSAQDARSAKKATPKEENVMSAASTRTTMKSGRPIVKVAGQN